MHLRVTRVRIRGVRLPQKQWGNAPYVDGDLRTYRIKDEVTGGSIVRATVAGSTGGQESLLPELNDVRLVGVAPLAMVLTGFERVQMRQGAVDFLQEWWIRPIL